MAVDKRRAERLRGQVKMLDTKLAESLGQESPSLYRYLQLAIGLLAMCLDGTEERQEIFRSYMVTGSAVAVSTPVGQSCKPGVVGSSTTPMHAVEAPRPTKRHGLGLQRTFECVAEPQDRHSSSLPGQIVGGQHPVVL